MVCSHIFGKLGRLAETKNDLDKLGPLAESKNDLACKNVVKSYLLLLTKM